MGQIMWYFACVHTSHWGGTQFPDKPISSHIYISLFFTSWPDPNVLCASASGSHVVKPMESSLLSLSCAIHQWIGFRENLGFFNLKLVESHGFLHQHIGGFQREFLVIPIAPKTTSRQASRRISTIAFWYHCLMWWKQCHLHHPPVITILKKVV